MTGFVGMIRLNGEPRALTAVTVAALLAELGVQPERKGVAVARNGAVVPRSAWPEAPLADGDEIDIIHPAAGG